MKRLLILACLLLVLPNPVFGAAGLEPRLEKAIAAGEDGPRQEDGTFAVWVYFNDKNLAFDELDPALASARANLSERTLERRQRVTPQGQSPVDLRDVPLAGNYLQAVTATGAKARRTSRWLNAASFDATAEQIDSINRLPFVRKVDLVSRFVRPIVQPDPDAHLQAERNIELAREKNDGRWTLDYGASLPTLEQINVPPVHELGLSGRGVIIAQLDAGFVLSHVSLQHIPIVAQWDFVHDDDSVEWEEGDHEWQHRHGSQVLSTFAGLSSGELVGPAYGASVILAMTEDTGSETEIEEDNWVAAVEWVEGLGADMLTSSLGYYYWYDFEDLDGNTAVTTIAADMAVERGMPVFTSAGNERENSEFPHLTAPADGDSVIAMAAVDVSGELAFFSSPGPTFDGRIKPDLAAQGYNNFVANYYHDEYYMLVDGTSFACPLVAGVGALMLERLPTLTPMQIREAFRATSTQSENPDNDLGWGIIDAYAAVAYWGATIEHEPLADSEDLTGPYPVQATITSRTGLDSEALYLFWRVDGGDWNREDLVNQGGDFFGADIPGQAGGGFFEYYLEAGDNQDFVVQIPHGGNLNPWSFVVGQDVIAPEMFHVALIDQLPAHWPTTVTANVTDNVGVSQVVLEYTLNDGTVQGPYNLTPDGDDYSLLFPILPGGVDVGDVLVYWIRAEDTAATANVTVSGPWEFRVVENLGQVLVIDNTVFSQPGDDPAKSSSRTVGTDMAQWLMDAGYDVEVMLPGNVNGESLQGRDAVFVATDDNPYPLGLPLLRAYLVEYVNRGGRVLVEGGAVADVIFGTALDPDFAATVLHAEEYWSSFIGPLTPGPGYDHHPLMVRPHVLTLPVDQDLSSNPYSPSTSDAVVPTNDADLVMRSIYNASVAGVVAYDQNTAPEAGQTVYLSLALSYLDETDASELVENSIAYLLAREAPGNSVISGTITLSDSEDASGVTVSCTGGTSVVTGPDGQYSLTQLHGATYTVTADLDGYGSAQTTVQLAAGQSLSGVDLTLHPIVSVAYEQHPDLPIPDYNEDGISSVITVNETGLVHDLSVDIDITHPSVGQLVVTLTSPQGTVVTLHNQTGATADDIIGNWPATLLVDGPGTLDDFLVELVQGDWTLTVKDLNYGAWGHFNSWGLNLDIAADTLSPVPHDLPLVTALVGNMPNPFNPMTAISFDLHKAGPVELTVHDLRGRTVRRLLQEDLPAGRHQVNWDGKDAEGRSVASGLYFCRMQANAKQELLKMTLLK